MKRLQLLTIILTLSTLSYGQVSLNQSDGTVVNGFSSPIQQFGGQEIFRFQPGIVTQLQSGTSFDFSSSQWFSIGNLDTSLLPPPLTGTNEVFGLRFQLPRKALVMGYQDISDINPRLQWLGQGAGEFLGNLEFRVADDFQSTNSDLVATMRNDTGTVFGVTSLSDFENSKVGILDFQFDKALNIIQEINSENPTYGVDVFKNGASPENYGYNATISLGAEAEQNFGFNSLIEGSANQNFGFNAIVEGTAGRNFGYNALVNGNAGTNFGVFAEVSNAVENIGIYGSVPTSGGSDTAGFFNGDVFTTGLYLPSDNQFKKNISEIEFASDKLMMLKPKMYEYIKSDKINLSQGNQYGFMAQELEEVFPELIKNIKKPVFDENNNIVEYLEYKSVNYLGLIAILTASIQELTAEVNELKENKETYVVYEAAFTQEELAKIAQNGYRLEQNYPNPFQGRSSIAYALPEAENNASIMIFDMTGKTIKEYPLKEKQGQIQIDSQDFRPGIYLYSLIGNNKEIITKRMIVK